MWMKRFFIPEINPTILPEAIDLRWIQVREQILTGVLRIGSILGLLTAIAFIAPINRWSIDWLGSFYLICVAIIWYMAIQRTLRYHVRVGVLLSSLYLLGISELYHFGITYDAIGFFAAFALFGVILLGSRIGLLTLIASTLTMLAFGIAVSFNQFQPVAVMLHRTNVHMTLSACIIFGAVVGGLQVGISMLFKQIELEWLNAQHVREQLEQRVIERTSELAIAHQKALELSQYRTEQNSFLATLNQTTIDLLRNQDDDTLLHSIVASAARLLDAPYTQLMLIDGDELVTHATSSDLAFLTGNRSTRDQARVSWQAADTGTPIIISNYQTLPNHHTIYDPLRPQAIASFPIMIDQRCLGVLGLGRRAPSNEFNEETIQKGILFSQLVAVVLQNREHYTTALTEIRIRSEAEEQLRHQNSELDAFAHTVAHDLKNPLSALLGNTQFLRIAYTKMLPDDVETQFETIVTAGMKMNTIIESLLMLSSVRLQQNIQPLPLDMRAIISEVLFSLQIQIEQSNATINIPTTWPVALGYGPWIEEVWINYLTNALKYGGSPPVITIGVDQLSDGMLRFWVEDNGPGIPPEQHELLFMPFTRFRPTEVQGYGLGLSIVQRIITKLNGQVGIESVPAHHQHGSRFFFTLPSANLDGEA
ncbi:MAG: hypothetical protein OHK0050_37430 [Roseiflexaceae bacterium]